VESEPFSFSFLKSGERSAVPRFVVARCIVETTNRGSRANALPYLPLFVELKRWKRDAVTDRIAALAML
jgi:hypothetical protein